MNPGEPATALQSGDAVDVRALHADGVAYRWWRETVEAIDAEKVVTVSPPGKEVHGPLGDWVSRYASRTYYWFARPYILAEVYQPDGALLEIYVHIASPPTLAGHRLTYVDHELNVVLRPGQTPEVVDEDEFAEAAMRYGYPAEFQEQCRQTVAEVLDLIVRWEPKGTP